MSALSSTGISIFRSSLFFLLLAQETGHGLASGTMRRGTNHFDIHPGLGVPVRVPLMSSRAHRVSQCTAAAPDLGILADRTARWFHLGRLVHCLVHFSLVTNFELFDFSLVTRHDLCPEFTVRGARHLGVCGGMRRTDVVFW